MFINISHDISVVNPIHRVSRLTGPDFHRARHGYKRAHFDKPNKDADQTLDSQEVKGAIGPKLFKQANPHTDGTLTQG
jgi:hypothetical protein